MHITLCTPNNSLYNLFKETSRPLRSAATNATTSRLKAHSKNRCCTFPATTTTAHSSAMRNNFFSKELTEMSGVATLGGGGIMTNGARARAMGRVVYTGLPERATLVCGGENNMLGSNW